MTLITFTTLLASVMALACSIGALLVAVRSLRQYRSTSSVALSARLSECESTVEALTAKVKGLNSRVSMQLLREKRLASAAETEPEPADPEKDAQLQRERLNNLLAQRKPT